MESLFKQTVRLLWDLGEWNQDQISHLAASALLDLSPCSVCSKEAVSGQRWVISQSSRLQHVQNWRRDCCGNYT